MFSAGLRVRRFDYRCYFEATAVARPAAVCEFASCGRLKIRMPPADSTAWEAPLKAESPLGVTGQGIWALAWPTIIAMGAGTIVRFTDFAMARGLGPSALGAVGVGGQFYWLIESLAALGGNHRVGRECVR